MSAAIQPFLNKVNDAIINPIIAVLFGVAIVVFIWGIVQMVAKSDSEEELKKGKQNILYGLIGMFIMTSVFFLMQVVVSTFDLDDTPHGDPIQSVIDYE